MATVENTLNKLMDNPLVVGVIAIALTMYGPRLSPKLPDPIRNAFNSSFFRFLVMVLVIFVGYRDIRVSLVVAILFMVLMSITNQQNIKEDFEQQINEYYANYNLFSSVEHFENAQLQKEEAEQTKMVAELNTQSIKPGDDKGEASTVQVQKNQSPFKISQEIDMISQMANNSELGLSNKCKAYFNNLKNQSGDCLTEFQSKLEGNEQLRNEYQQMSNDKKSM